MKFVFKEWEKRLAVCNGCEHSHPILGQITCGTPLMGETIIVDDKKVSMPFPYMITPYGSFDSKIVSLSDRITLCKLSKKVHF